MNQPLSNKEKYAQLGLTPMTARTKLRKAIIYDLLNKLKMNRCFVCGKKIGSVDELSIEHKHAWLNTDNPVKQYFDLQNIIYIHMGCQQDKANKLSQLEAEKTKVKPQESSPSKRVSSTGFKNVYAHTNPKKPYRVRVRENGKFKSFGTFETVLEAVMEADKQLLRINGEQAVTNKKLGLILY